ncbi:MAG: Na+/H+ antiporter NhaA [Atopobiaceae bacterium]|nr:Na+/H+ antiporter NhaA [Atopobiaceae bacterium]
MEANMAEEKLDQTRQNESTAFSQDGSLPEALSPVIEEEQVLRRLGVRSAFREITSNSTIAAGAMVICALLAVLVANTPAYEVVESALRWPVEIRLGSFVGELSLEGFVNDFLMAIFFLEVGIELKYEMTVGELANPRQAAVPMLAAVGGVACPALIYLAFNAQGGAPHGWAVPIATDIAFALGVMSLAGDRIAVSTKVFFQTLAIADDILAIVVIALFYGQSPDIAWCAASAIVVLVLMALNHAKVYSVKPYLIVGLVLWFCMYNSGIHATLAGVILAFTLPGKSDIRLSSLGDWLSQESAALDDVYDDESHILGQHDFTEHAYIAERVLHHATPPLRRVERYFSVFTNFFILPVFAFVNAQVRLVGVDMAAVLAGSVTRGAYFGAVLGKPLGIILVTLVLVKLGFAKLPRGMDVKQAITMGLMGGVGFTMSILISGLAFADAQEQLEAKCAILAASVTSALLGLAFIHIADAVTKGRKKEPDKASERVS